MSSCLEKIPRDILHNIVFLASTASPFDPPSSLFNLLQTNSNIYHALSHETWPHLHSSIFKTKFDVAAPNRRYSDQLTDSAFASEFIFRCRVLRRASRGDVSCDGLKQDLWTALWMILESDGINDAQLIVARFPSFILALLRARAVHDKTLEHGGPEFEVLSLAVWLLWLTFSRNDILQLSLDVRQEIFQVLRPFALSKTKGNLYQCPCASCPAPPLDVNHNQTQDTVSSILHYARKCNTPCLNPTIPAITLTFALKEVDPLVAPPHLPANRAVALATLRSGPTLEDFRIVENFKTLLLADSRISDSSNTAHPEDRRRSLKHDSEFSGLLSFDSNFMPSSSYIPGSLTGIWQGTYMIAPIPSTESSKPSPISNQDFACRKPMQCVLSEYLCFSPNLPIPADGNWDTKLSPRRLLELEDGFEICSRKYGYQKYHSASKVLSNLWRSPNQALDVIIAGETLVDHDQAWGGFKFAGRVRRDGLIILKRESKNTDEEHLGTWIFEGRLNFDKSLVGRWRLSTSLESSNFHGIFSMTKRACNREGE